MKFFDNKSKEHLAEYKEFNAVEFVKKINAELPGVENAGKRAKLKMDAVEKILNSINNENI